MIYLESPSNCNYPHCEDDPMIKAKEQEFLAKYGKKIPVEMHSEIRSREACLKSSKKAIDLAERYGANLHILHLTTKEEVELFSNKPLNEKMITAEVCIPHLYFSLGMITPPKEP